MSGAVRPVILQPAGDPAPILQCSLLTQRWPLVQFDCLRVSEHRLAQRTDPAMPDPAPLIRADSAVAARAF